MVGWRGVWWGVDEVVGCWNLVQSRFRGNILVAD